MDVRDVANRLIQLFWFNRVEGLKLSCTRMKIGRLLLIVQILSIKCMRERAFEDIIVSETCGVSVPILSVYRYPYNIYDLDKSRMWQKIFAGQEEVSYAKNVKIAISSMSAVSADLPKFYTIDSVVEEKLNMIINAVFIEFGAYDSYDLGLLINDFKDEICVDGIVIEHMIADWLCDLRLQLGIKNKLVEFIKNFSLG